MALQAKFTGKTTTNSINSTVATIFDVSNSVGRARPLSLALSLSAGSALLGVFPCRVLILLYTLCSVFYISNFPTASAEPLNQPHCSTFRRRIKRFRRRIQRRSEKREPKSLPSARVESWRRRRRCGELRASTVQRYVLRASASGRAARSFLFCI